MYAIEKYPQHYFLESRPNKKFTHLIRFFNKKSEFCTYCEVNVQPLFGSCFNQNKLFSFEKCLEPKTHFSFVYNFSRVNMKNYLSVLLA